MTESLGLDSQACQAEEATGAGRCQGAGGGRLDLSRAKGTWEEGRGHTWSDLGHWDA